LAGINAAIRPGHRNGIIIGGSGERSLPPLVRVGWT
jgi:hypothetical protein